MRSLLPEKTRYRDTGCGISSSCLRCPLPACIFDVPLRRQLREARARRVQDLRGRGLTGAQVAMLVGVSARTVDRDLAQVAA